MERVLLRKLARDLTPSEIVQVSGGSYTGCGGMTWCGPDLHLQHDDGTYEPGICPLEIDDD